MSRFGSLEFNREQDNRSQPQRLEKNEAFYFEEARSAFESGRFEQALRSYSKVLEFNPNNAAAWTGQVRALIELGEFREAKVWADKALERFPQESELLAAKGVALGRCGDLDAALAFSDASMEERGDTPYLWLARGDVMLARQEQRADYCFEKALALAAKDWFVAWLAARIRYFYNQFSQALRLAQQALEWNPGHSPLWLLTGLCQQQLGWLNPARTALTQARQLDPTNDAVQRALLKLSEAGLWSRLSGWWRRRFLSG